MAIEHLKAEYSSNVSWCRYDPVTQRLEVDFKGKDGQRVSTYHYADFPQEEWRLFQEASSKGKHFAYQIRPRFKGVKQNENA